MKLGTQTNSLVNHLLSCAVIDQPEPVEGMGATVLFWTDRHPATIVAVTKYGKRTMLLVREDSATRIDSNGLSESQSYTFAPNPHGAAHHFMQQPDGRWDEVRWNPETKRWRKTGGSGLRIGERERYYDFSF